MQVLDPGDHYKVKCLLPFLGRRVIDWQLDELRESPYVEDLYLLGLSRQEAELGFPVQYVPCELTAEFPDKLAAGLAFLQSHGKEPSMVVISSSDAPAMRRESIDEFLGQLDQLTGYDVVLSLVPEDITEQEFPGSGRVVARFRDHQVHPGELYALSPGAIARGQEIIGELGRRRRLIDRHRKRISLKPVIEYVARKPRTWPLILKFLLKRASLQDGERAVSIAFDCKAKGIIIRDVGFGMDMDLPEDYERLEAYVARSKLAPARATAP